MRSKKPWVIVLVVVSPSRPGLQHQLTYNRPFSLSQKEAESQAIQESEKDGNRVIRVLSALQRYA